jgi:DNA-binding NarL/FixJ family response regulator
MPDRRPTRRNAVTKTRILLVDDHALFRRGLASLIETEPDLAVCAEADSHQSALEAIAVREPALVIADLSLKNSEGLELIKDIKRRWPGLPVLVLSMHDESVHAERALQAGARGYVTKQDFSDTVLAAIRRLLAGEIHTSEAIARKLAEKFINGGRLDQRSGIERLSDREFEVFKLVGQGKTNREIASHLGVSVKTIETHREHLKVKLGQPTGAGLSRCAILWLESGRLN